MAETKFQLYQFFMLAGGAFGFAIPIIAGFNAGNEPSYTLRNAAIGCVLGAIVGRVLHHVVANCVRAARTQQRTPQQDKEKH